ncbi:MAG: hypothetical protein MUF12_09440 [Sediminibacterium sp.]|jgi:hypothetical protein|nr:hypothetical protein [Sediminibacterium sp.]
MKTIIDRPSITESTHPKLFKAYSQLNLLLNALQAKVLPQDTSNTIDQAIDEINAIADTDRLLIKKVKEKQNAIIKLLEKQHKIVPKNYYRNLWMVVGMSAFGLPIGVAFGMSIGNLAMLGIGMPIGMAIGIGVGSSMDKKALEEGRQLDFEVKM